jgi:hypothetical protein
MSDERKTREAIERTAARIKDQSQKQGRTISYGDAKGKAREIAVNYKRKYPQQH